MPWDAEYHLPRYSYWRQRRHPNMRHLLMSPSDQRYYRTKVLATLRSAQRTSRKDLYWGGAVWIVPLHHAPYNVLVHHILCTIDCAAPWCQGAAAPTPEFTFLWMFRYRSDRWRHGASPAASPSNGLTNGCATLLHRLHCHHLGLVPLYASMGIIDREANSHVDAHKVAAAFRLRIAVSKSKSHLLSVKLIQSVLHNL